jgi:hypothetical protein
VGIYHSGLSLSSQRASAFSRARCRP